jgi:cobalt-zinc-cadmium efflux system outer membrane protein
LERAYANNREIASARYNLPVAQAGITIAGAVPNPHFSLLYGWGPEWRIIIAGQPQQFGWQFDLQTAGKRTKQLAVARANYKVVEFQVAQVMFDVHNRVRRAYAEQAAAEAYAELIESERKVALQLVKIADARFRTGKGPMSDYLQAELGVMQFDTQRNQAQARLQQASAALALITGELPEHQEVIDVDDNGLFKLSAEVTALVPSPDRALPALEQLVPVAYNERPDLKVALQQKHSDQKAITLAKAQRVPDVFVDVGYQFSTFYKKQPYGLFAGAVENQPGCYLNISLANPIFYQQQGEIAQAKATWLQDIDQVKQLQCQIGTDTVTAYEAVKGARANIGQFQTALIPEAALVAKQAFRRYQLGKADLSSAILARQQYQQILSSYFDSVVAYQNAWADLEKAIGVSLNL